MSPVWLSLQVAGTATLLTVLSGLPVAWLLGRRQFRGRMLVETLIVLPLVLPPTVLGYYLLVLLSRQGAIGGLFDRYGIELAFTWRGAVIAAWVGSFAMFTRSAQAGFELVDARLEDAARTLGRSEWALFWRITLPLAWRGVLAGTMLAFCRAVGEFGITLMVAGNIPGRTQTIPLAIYDHVQANRLEAADRLSLLTLLIVAGLLLLVGRLVRGRG
jgi:molybdate transport system permease protein